QGCSITTPYGAWLAHYRKDAIIMPKPLADHLGTWLKQNEALFPEDPVADLAILYDHRVAWEEEEFGGVPRFHPGTVPGRKAHQNLKDLGTKLCREHLLYRVELVSEHHPLTAERLARYRFLILPDCSLMPEDDCQVVSEWIADGGQALVIGNAPACVEGLASA